MNYGTVIRFVDSKLGCWSRLTLPSGEPIWISVAQSGVVVKKSKLGLMGATLFNEKNAFKAAMTAKQLDSEVAAYVTPMGMTNLVLRAFTQATMGCSNAAECAIRLNEALAKV